MADRPETNREIGPGSDLTWEFETSSKIRSSPTVVDGTVCFGTDSGRIYALDADSGRHHWRFDSSASVLSSPAIVRGTVYVGCKNGTVYALDAESGEKVWQFNTDAAVYSSPTVVDGTVYVGSFDNNVYALDGASGEVLWLFDTGAEVWSSPTVVDETLYIGSYDNSVYALDPGSGSERWQFETDNWVRSSPTVVNNTVYIGSRDASLYALNRTSGEKRWRFTTGAEVGSSPTAADGTVYVGSQDGHVYALGGGSGKEIWRFDTGNRVGSSPTVLGNTVYVGCRNSNLFAIDVTSADLRWSFQTAGKIYSSPTVVDGTVYVGSGDGRLYAIETGNSGSSEGSRVQLGTLGHHDAWVSGRTVTDDETTPREAVRAERDAREQATDALDSAEDALYEAAWAIDGGLLEDASGQLDDALTALADAADVIEEHDLPALAERADRLDSRHDTLREQAKTKRETREQATDALDSAEEASTAVVESLDGTPQDALDHLDGWGKALDTAEELIEDHEFPDLADRLDTLREAHENARERVRATGALDTAEKTLDAAAESLDDGTPQEALDHLDGVGEPLDTAEQLIHPDFPDFAETADRLAALQQRHERLRQTAEDALTRTPPAIPTTPRHSLSYEDIERGELIGSGGNADVYHATVATDDGTVELALKEPRMSGTLHTDVVERMMQEAETWQQLDDHDHIVSVVDYDAEPLPWIAMEHMDVGHLGERAGTLDVEQAIWTAVETTNAVQHAHRRGVAHLDLKPENVLFRSVENAWDVPKVADWGLSKHLLTHSKSVEGLSPHYAAPEQFDDEYGSTDDITDIYQLGAVFYELFTGRPPFEGQPVRVMNKIVSEEPSPPSTHADVPRGLDEILLTALATEKRDRHEHVLYLRDDLQELRGSV